MSKPLAKLREPLEAFDDGPNEKARMGQLAGLLWMAAAAIVAVGSVLPGAAHGPVPWLLLTCLVAFLYGLASATRLIPWGRASMRFHAVASATTFPLIAVTIYFSGNASSYVEPLLVVPMFYSAFFFPGKLAWPLNITLMALAGLPLLTDPDAIRESFLPRYIALCAAFTVLTWVIVGLRERLTASEERQREMANTDHLTGVGNRRTFDRRLRRELLARNDPEKGRRQTDQTSLAVLVLDLDGFKSINDQLGHPVGDQVLCEVAGEIEGLLRAGDTVARIGGDEFAVIAPGAGSERARQLAAAIGTALADRSGSGLPRPGASIGWAVFPEDGRDHSSLLHTADDRMLQEKRERRDLNPRPLA